MNRRTLKIGPGVTCDLDRLIATRLLVQANSGAGKTWTLRRLLEQSHGKIQQIVLDPEGEFSSLRSRFDYVLVAKQGGDALADPRTAALLAERLLELGVSAILDIYELAPHERVRFVRLFLEALVDAPKKLWHPVLVVIDEAHVYCPEKGDAESANAVKGLCSRGRKRGFCAVLATQRLSKLAKDAAAELNNKLIGRTSLDVDMARAGDELGFTKTDRLLLRDLDDGQFFAFGPALSRTVTKVRVGAVVTEHPKAGKLAAVAPPPSARVKALLPKLSDLPKEAEARETTVAGLKTELAAVRRELAAAKSAQPKIQTKTVERFMLKDVQIARLTTELNRLGKDVDRLSDVGARITDHANRFEIVHHEIESALKAGQPPWLHTEYKPVDHLAAPPRGNGSSPTGKKHLPTGTDNNGLPPGELAVLKAVGQFPGIERDRLSVLTGYKKSSRDAYVARAINRGYIVPGRQLQLTEDGTRALGSSFEPLPTGEALVTYWRQNLPDGERKVFDAIIEGHTERERIREVTGYKKSSTDAYLARLKARGVIATNGRGAVQLAEAITHA